MGMSSTCVLLYAMPSLQWCMPCIFVISVVTSTSMQTRLRGDCCYFVAMYPCVYREIHAPFGDVQQGYFVDIVVIDPFLQLFAIMECHSMTKSCSTFAIKYFWQIVYVLFNFAKLVVVDPFMLCTCSCHG